MRGNNKIYHRPYIPINRPEWAEKPFICRLAPFDSGFELEWLSKSVGVHTLFYAKSGEDDYAKVTLADSVEKVDGLLCDTDYELYIENEEGVRSNVRLLRTGIIPEGKVVVNYLHPEDEQYKFSGQYLCSPSLVRAPDGSLVAGMDVFEEMNAQNLTLLFNSYDNGKTWRYLTDIYPFYWSSLFTHKGYTYILGLTTEYGNIQIAKSSDSGKTWTAPVTLFYGSNILCETNGGCHRAPMHIVHHNGRLYTTFEYGNWWPCAHMPSVASIDENDDLLVPENWSCTGFLKYEGKWAEDAVERGDSIEGNVLKGPDGKLYNYLRWKTGEFLRLEIDADNPENPLKYDGIYEAPVSNSMFRILPYKDKYIIVTNRKTEISGKVKCASYRNVLSMFLSDGLREFELVEDIFNYETYPATDVGFQYPVVIVEDDAVHMLVRSALNGAHSFHDSNYMLFCSTSTDIIDKAIK